MNPSAEYSGYSLTTARDPVFSSPVTVEKQPAPP
jgi:hypothetical protein